MSQRTVEGLDNLQNSIGYHFSDEKLLINALTHSSYAQEQGYSYSANNERLEFIGDAYLGSVVAKKLYDIMSEVQEGVLSKKRAEVVCERTLAEVARKISLGEYLLLGKGEDKHSGADKPSILSDAMEAVIGAIFIDGGFDECKRVVLDLFMDKIRLAVKGELVKDWKSELQKEIQKKYRENRLEYVMLEESGPAHDRNFIMEVRHNGEPLAKGCGKSKLKAEQAAAEAALKKGEI
ncbi:MAG: ribonuclease III [Clostridiales bacterium]|nr:ribonuclease III [Candidatus Crickella merdequi]